MSSLKLFLTILAASFGSALGVPKVQADELRVPVLLRYESAPGCPSVESFRQQVEARSRRIALVEDPATADTVFSVLLSRGSRGCYGKLEIRSAESVQTVREIQGMSCDDVIPALAFVAVLAVDPQAGQAPEVVPEAASGGAAPAAPEKAVPEAAPASPQGRFPAQEAPPTAPPKAKQTDPRPGEQRLARPGQPQGSPTHWRFAAGVLGQLARGLFPSSSPAASLYLETETQNASPWGLAPRFRFSLNGALSRAAAAGPGEAHFQWGAVALSGCPVRWAIHRRWTVSPCAVAELGFFRGEAQGLNLPLPADARTWGALGGSAQIRWHIGSRLFSEVEGTLIAPLSPPKSVVELNNATATVHQVGRVVGFVGWGLGLFL